MIEPLGGPRSSAKGPPIMAAFSFNACRRSLLYYELNIGRPTSAYINRHAPFNW
jgi:hypothetical protein